MSPRRKTAGSSSDADIDDEDYKKKRERNNQAVKLCREKSTKKTQQTKMRISKLKTENIQLEQKIKGLKENVETLKQLLLASDSTEERKQAIKKIIEDAED